MSTPTFCHRVNVTDCQLITIPILDNYLSKRWLSEMNKLGLNTRSLNDIYLTTE